MEYVTSDVMNTAEGPINVEERQEDGQCTEQVLCGTENLVTDTGGHSREISHETIGEVAMNASSCSPVVTDALSCSAGEGLQHENGAQTPESTFDNASGVTSDETVRHDPDSSCKCHKDDDRPSSSLGEHSCHITICSHCQHGTSNRDNLDVPKLFCHRKQNSQGRVIIFSPNKGNMKSLHAKFFSETALQNLDIQSLESSNLHQLPYPVLRPDQISTSSQTASLADNDVRVEISPADDMSCPPSYDTVVCQNKAVSPKLFDVFGSRRSAASTPPPTYRQATGNGRYLSDAPPTYHSLFAESMLRAMHPFGNASDSGGGEDNGASSDQASIFRKFVASVIILVAMLLTLAVVVILPITMIVVGISNISNCPVQPRIPIYLIVLGIFQMFECCGRLGLYIYKSRNSNDRHQRNRTGYRNKDPMIYFMVVWFVVGSMWVYQADPDCFLPILTGKDVVTEWNMLEANSTSVKPTVHLTDAKITSLTAGSNNSGILITAPPWLTTNALPSSTTSSTTLMSCCGKLVYHLAFWLVTAYYGIVGLLCSFCIIDATVRVLVKCCCNR